MRHSTIDFEALRYLLAAAEAGAISRAAKMLDIDTGSLSKRIQRIEDELGLTVFERGHEGVRPTVGGEAILIHARRVMAELSFLFAAGEQNAKGMVGRIRIGTRLPTAGQPIQSMLATWHKQFPEVELSVFELNDRDILTGIEERRLDVALMTQHTVWPRAVWEPMYHERLLVALPRDHPLGQRRTLTWDLLREETLLVQGWDESQAARELYASFLGSGAHYTAHAASKQSILGLVAAGFGITLVTEAQAHVKVPGVLYRPIFEKNAVIQVVLVWVRENENAVVGRFVSFMRQFARARVGIESRCLSFPSTTEICRVANSPPMEKGQ
jgi:DNA-binding transcriptional LysR family regulator